jgi:hypothetical protein
MFLRGIGTYLDRMLLPCIGTHWDIQYVTALYSHTLGPYYIALYWHTSSLKGTALYWHTLGPYVILLYLHKLGLYVTALCWHTLGSYATALYWHTRGRYLLCCIGTHLEHLLLRCVSTHTWIIHVTALYCHNTWTMCYCAGNWYTRHTLPSLLRIGTHLDHMLLRWELVHTWTICYCAVLAHIKTMWYCAILDTLRLYVTGPVLANTWTIRYWACIGKHLDAITALNWHTLGLYVIGLTTGTHLRHTLPRRELAHTWTRWYCAENWHTFARITTLRIGTQLDKMLLLGELAHTLTIC